LLLFILPKSNFKPEHQKMKIFNAANHLPFYQFATLSFLILSTCIGCGGNTLGTVPSGGTVLLDDAPVEGATVIFNPEGADSRAASGITDSKGVFKLTTEVNGDGAVPGSYKISITKWDKVPENMPKKEDFKDDSAWMDAVYRAKEKQGKGVEPKNELAAVYANSAGSGLNATVVNAGPNEFSFKLKKK